MSEQFKRLKLAKAKATSQIKLAREEGHELIDFQRDWHYSGVDGLEKTIKKVPYSDLPKMYDDFCNIFGEPEG